MCYHAFREKIDQFEQACPGRFPGPSTQSITPSSFDSSKDDGILLPRLVCEADKMSMLSAAALLDELMGVDRDRAPNEKKTALHWSDPQVFIAMRMAFLPYISILLT